MTREDELVQLMLRDSAVHKEVASRPDRGFADPLPLKRRVWTAERSKQLLQMERDRVPRADMAVELRVTVNSIHGQLARLKQGRG